jgi:uncharacterized Tic20 family protein
MLAFIVLSVAMFFFVTLSKNLREKLGKSFANFAVSLNIILLVALLVMGALAYKNAPEKTMVAETIQVTEINSQ